MPPTIKQAIFDGQFIDESQPAIPVVSRGLMYGDGVFETFRTYRGKTFLLESHLDRLKAGLDFLGISYPAELSLKIIKSLLYKLLMENNQLQKDVIIRLQVWRGGKRGYTVDPDAESHFTITTSVCPVKFQPPQLVTVKQKRIPSKALPSEYKLTNAINYILASQQAAEKGGDDALMQTIEGRISETTVANIFWIRGNTVFTPSTDCDLLPGITRNVLIDLINKSDQWQLTSGSYKLKEVQAADAVWISNSVREILPVRQLNDYCFYTHHPVINKIREHYYEFRNQKLKSLT